MKKVINLIRHSSFIYVASAFLFVLLLHLANSTFGYIFLLGPLVVLYQIFKKQNTNLRIFFTLAVLFQLSSIFTDIRINYFYSYEIDYKTLPEIALSLVFHLALVYFLYFESKKAIRLIDPGHFAVILIVEMLSSLVFFLVFVPYLPYSYTFQTIFSYMMLISIKYFALRRNQKHSEFYELILGVVFLLIFNYMWFTIQFINKSGIFFLIMHFTVSLSNYFLLINLDKGLKRIKSRLMDD